MLCPLLGLTPLFVPVCSQTLLEATIYGGRIDNPFDMVGEPCLVSQFCSSDPSLCLASQGRLNAFIKGLFTARSYDVDHPLSSTFDEKVRAVRS